MTSKIKPIAPVLYEKVNYRGEKFDDMKHGQGIEDNFAGIIKSLIKRQYAL